MDRLIANPNWTLFLERDLLVLSAGGDETYLIDDVVDPALVRRIHQAYLSDNLAEIAADPACAGVVRQLLQLKAILPARAQIAPQRVGVAWFGQPLPALTAKLASGSATEGTPPWLLSETPSDATDILLLVRTNAGWQETLKAYRDLAPQVPHLFVDLAYHHTLSIGPFVVPGETACLGCFANRVAHRWGDPPLPPRPAVNEEIDVAVAVLRRALLAEDASPRAPLAFVERVTSLDLGTLRSQSSRLFQLPDCPTCGPENTDARPLPLPWLGADAVR